MQNKGKENKKQKARKSSFAVDWVHFARYILYFVMMVLLAFAKGVGGLAPFHLGLYAALVYCRENIYLLSLEYVLALVIADVSIYTLIIGVVPCVVFLIAKGAHALAKKPIKILHTNIYAAISSIPVIVLNLGSIQMILNGIATVIISQVFTYCAVIIAYAVLVRGARYRFNKDELFGAAVVLAALSDGLYALSIAGFTPFYFLAPFILLMCVYAGSAKCAFVVAVAMGLGAGAMSANVMIVGGLVICSAMAMIFMSSNIYFASFSYLLGDLLVGAYFKAFGAYGYQHLIMTSVSVLIFLLVPNACRQYIVQSFGGGSCDAPARAMVSRNRREVSAKLTNMAKVFGEIGGVIAGGDVYDITVDSTTLAQNIVADYCAKCPNVIFCTNMLGGDISPNIQQVVDIASAKGGVTRADLPPFLASRCVQVEGLLDIINERTAGMTKYADRHNEISAGRMILGEQMASISELLVDMASDIKNSVFFDGEREKRIMEELSYSGIVAREILLSGEDGGYGVTVTVRNVDKDKPELYDVIQKVLKNKFEVVEKSATDIVGYTNIRMMMLPRYAISYGVSNQTMAGSLASGDTYSVERLGQHKVMLALCDGMGSGVDANINSSTTISMIENFYKAGFNNNAILSLLNKILATYNGEKFTCLDMGIIDLATGALDIIKLGGVQSLLLRQGNIESISASSLPLGIVEEAKPYTERKILFADDVLVMFTDGVVDTLGLDGIEEIIRHNYANNPQALADSIMHSATYGGAKDDSTVLVAKIVEKN